MNNMLARIIILLVFTFVSTSGILYSQNMSKKQDSLRAIAILEQAKIEITNKSVSLNSSGLQLALTEKQVLKVIKIVLYSTYGKTQIRKQRPFHVVRVGIYWVVYGNIKPNRKGGVFEIVVNSENACVEYLSHWR